VIVRHHLFMSRTLLFLGPLPLVLAITFFSGRVATWWYVHVDRPTLSQTYLPAQLGLPFRSCADKFVPKRVDLAQASERAGDRIEHFVSPDGNTTVNHCSNGQWRSTETDCVTTQRQGYFSGIGFMLFAFAAIKRSARTRVWFYRPGRHTPPMSSSEMILSVYGAGIFLVAMIAPNVPCL
jgi:hypothetical protein